MGRRMEMAEVHLRCSEEGRKEVRREEDAFIEALFKVKGMPCSTTCYAKREQGNLEGHGDGRCSPAMQ